MNLDLIIPTYNRSHLLDECLKSVFRAARPKGMKINVVVVDNNSTDNTKEIVQPYLNQHELECQYIFVGRPGKSAAVNEALAQTSSEFVGFIDDDEQIEKSWFEVGYREMTGDSTLEYIGGPYYPNWEIPFPNFLPPLTDYGKGVLAITFYSERAQYLPGFAGMLMGGNIIIRRSTLEKVLPYPEMLGKIGNYIRSGMDELIYHRLLRIGARGFAIPDLIIYHWIPAERLTKSYYRKWTMGRAIGVGYQTRERGYAGTGLLGISRYKVVAGIRGLHKLATSTSQQGRFLAELSVRECLGMLYGRHLYGRLSLEKFTSSVHDIFVKAPKETSQSALPENDLDPR